MIDLLDSLAKLISAAALCMSPFVGLLGVLLGVQLQRHALAEERRREESRRALEEKIRPVVDWLHYASVVASVQPEVSEIGVEGLAEFGAKDAYLEWLRLGIFQQGPAYVHLLTLGDKDLIESAVEVRGFLQNLVQAVREDKPLEEVLELATKCNTAIAKAKLRIEEIKKQALAQAR